MLTYTAASTIFCFLLHPGASEIIRFDNAIVKQPEFLTIAKYSSGEAPHWAPGYGKSYIDLSHVEVRQDCDKSQGKCSEKSVLDILIFEDKSAKPNWMDHWPDRKFCCTAEMVSQNHCAAADEKSLVVPYSLSGVYKINAEVSSDKSVEIKDTNSVSLMQISSTGMYIIVLAVCDAESSPVAINGEIDSLDPYGYLPADEFGDLPFYGSLALAHILVGLVWAVVCYCYRQDLMFLQLWISVLLVMGVMETVIFFAYYVDWNANGETSLGLLTLALVLGVVKRTIARLLVLIIALGYGVVKPSLGDDLKKIVGLGASYFVLSLVYTLYSQLPGDQKQSVDDPDFDLVSIIILLLMAVEATFYLWIFKSLGNLLDSLAARKQAAKYQLYRGFQTALLFSLLLTCALGIFTIAQTSFGNPDREWKDDWLQDGYWELAYFVVFTSIAFLFAPSNNYQRYAYSAQLATGDDDEADLSTDMPDDPTETDVDREYGGRLEDGTDPFGGNGALDVKQAVLKKA